jgi:RNA methyltransferase, TrmH family
MVPLFEQCGEINMADTITSVKNEYIKYARSLGEKKYRYETRTFLVEGEKCVFELSENMPECARGVIICGEKYIGLAEKLKSSGAAVYKVRENILDSVCETKTPQGIAAIAGMPEYESVYSGFIVMLDGVQDPQNVGTIIRTADAAGCSCVVISEESADPYSPKAVRASMGSIFHIPVISTPLAGYINKLSRIGYKIVSSHLEGDTEYRLDWEKTCLIIGNESRGISEEILNLSDRKIKIPMYGKAESLNAAVAAGILIYKIRA